VKKSTGDKLVRIIESNEKLRKIISLLSKKNPISPSQISFIMGIDPSESILLVQDLIDRGLIDGSNGVSWNKLCSLSTKGILVAQSFEEGELI
jgi:predicted transcriptional regulator